MCAKQHAVQAVYNAKCQRVASVLLKCCQCNIAVQAVYNGNIATTPSSSWLASYARIHSKEKPLQEMRGLAHTDDPHVECDLKRNPLFQSTW